MVQCFKTFCFLSLLLSTGCFAGGVHLKFIGIDTTRGQLAIAIFDQRNASSPEEEIVPSIESLLRLLTLVLKLTFPPIKGTQCLYFMILIWTRS